MGKVRNNDATHSEIADVVNLTLDGVDCFMLHETVSTIKVIEFLNSTIMEAEEMVDYQNLHRLLMTQASISSISMVKRDYTNVMAIMACNAAMKNNANAIIALTETGKTAIMLSKYRPECPIIAVTSSSVVARNCLLLRGVLSLNVNLVETDTYERSIEMQTKAAISFIEANHLNKTLTGVAILVMGQRTGSEKLNTIRIIPLQYENSMNDDLKQ
ncbi:CLUMA_CG003734, isoform A [Clunio marinus]|uniref:CLUMA_CG003734, isoform A n=1 Tax=Clunio marinus TaxID=568069 RepID=A0A1J1HPM6_9DIPT|nr:CLUMA_CG003734, isoform A [Clunio marinus]